MRLVIPKPNPATPHVLSQDYPPERVDILETLELRFSRPTDFNDTFDTHYRVAKGAPGGLVRRSRLRTRLGVFCLTERANNHLMWVHYAQNHTGFVLGFDAKAPFFSADQRILRKVTYRSRPPILADADINACFSKSSVWKHEKEWRCVRRFETSESRNVIVDPSVVKKIVFGMKMQPWQIARIVGATNNLDIHPDYLISKAAKRSWTFDNMPKIVEFCGSCNGVGYNIHDHEK